MMKTIFFSSNQTQIERIPFALRLRWPELEFHVADSGNHGIQMVEVQRPDMVIICDHPSDLTMWEIITGIRDFSDVPVIVIIEKENVMDIVKAIELGADGYISPSDNLLTVVARILAIIRRIGLSAFNDVEEGPIFCGDLMINPATFDAYLRDSRLHLTSTEFKLLHLLVKNSHHTLSQEYIQRAIWTEDVERGDTTKKYIQRLRRKLGDDARNPSWIETVRGIGYRFKSPSSDASLT